MKDLRFSEVPVRVYEPTAPSEGLRRGLVYFHGGGWVMGSIGITYSCTRSSYFLNGKVLQILELYIIFLSFADHVATENIAICDLYGLNCVLLVSVLIAFTSNKVRQRKGFKILRFQIAPQMLFVETLL